MAVGGAYIIIIIKESLDDEPSKIQGANNVLEIFTGHSCIHLGSFQSNMTKQRLNITNIGAVL